MTGNDALIALLSANRNGAPLDFGAADSKRWVLAVDAMLDRGQLDQVRCVIPDLVALSGGAQYFVSVANALAALPEPSGDPGFDAFVDDRSLEVQVVRKNGAQATLLAFCAGDRLTLPVNLIHRWIGSLSLNVVYLRDRQTALYLAGIGSLAPDLDGTLQRLRAVIADLGAGRLVCYGGSKGGYGALLYALRLEADAVLALGAPTGGSPSDLTPPNLVDLRQAYAAADRAPRTHLVFAELAHADGEQAEHLRGLPTVSIEPVIGARDHGVAKDLVARGRLAPLLRGLAEPQVRESLWAAPGA